MIEPFGVIADSARARFRNAVPWYRPFNRQTL